MTRSQSDLFQGTEKITKIEMTSESRTVSKPLISPPVRTATCVICGHDFSPATSRASTCSDACRRERKLRYGAAYRHQGRLAGQKLLDMFGGRRPTGDEILQMLRAKSGQSCLAEEDLCK